MNVTFCFLKPLCLEYADPLCPLGCFDIPLKIGAAPGIVLCVSLFPSEFCSLISPSCSNHCYCCDCSICSWCCSKSDKGDHNGLTATTDKQLSSSVWEKPVPSSRGYRYGNIPEFYGLFYVEVQSS